MIRSSLLILSALGLMNAWPAVGQQPVVVDVGTAITVAGAPMDGVRIICEGGKITAIGKDAVPPADAVHVSMPQGVAFPGFVDAGGFIAGDRHRNETTKAVMASILMADALDPDDRSLRSARAAGITTFHLTPGESNLVGGRSAVAKVGDDGDVSWLRRDAFLKFSLVASAWDRTTPPTHLLGGLELFTQLRKDPGLSRFWDDRLMVAARTSPEIRAVSELRSRERVMPLLLTSSAVVDHVDALKGSVAGVILEPLKPELGNHWRQAAARLAAADIPLAFASQAPRVAPEGLRLSAVTARMGGLPKEAAWRALTLDAARMLGVADRVGSLEVGKDADILIMTREPTDPRARLMWVIQDGRVVKDPLKKDER